LRQDKYFKTGEDIPTEAFRVLGQALHDLLLHNRLPTHVKAFYIKPHEDNPELCEGFDLMWTLHRISFRGNKHSPKDQLINRLKEKGLNPASFKCHLQAYDYGMAPNARWGLGQERLTMILTGDKNSR